PGPRLPKPQPTSPSPAATDSPTPTILSRAGNSTSTAQTTAAKTAANKITQTATVVRAAVTPAAARIVKIAAIASKAVAKGTKTAIVRQHPNIETLNNSQPPQTPKTMRLPHPQSPKRPGPYAPAPASEPCSRPVSSLSSPDGGASSDVTGPLALRCRSRPTQPNARKSSYDRWPDSISQPPSTSSCGPWPATTPTQDSHCQHRKPADSPTKPSSCISPSQPACPNPGPPWGIRPRSGKHHSRFPRIHPSTGYQPHGRAWSRLAMTTSKPPSWPISKLSAPSGSLAMRQASSRS